MNTCAVTTLKIHSSGEQGTRFAPVYTDQTWQLKNANGDTLIGYRGKVYAFESSKNASNWLCTNLSRYKNKTSATSDEYLLQLGQMYVDTGIEAVRDDIRNIYDYTKGLWQVIECAGEIEYITIEASIDYDGGDANGLVI